MDDRLAQFLQYDYVGAKELAAAFFAASGGLLFGGSVFAKDFISLHETKKFRLFNFGMIGFYLFGAAGVFSGVSMLGNYGGMIRILHAYQGGIMDMDAFLRDVRFHNNYNLFFLIVAGGFVSIGIICLFKAACDRGRTRCRAPGGELL